MDKMQATEGQSSTSSGIELVSFNDAELFRQTCAPWLLEQEDINNGLIGMIDLLANGSSVYEKPFFLAALLQNSNLVGCCVYAKPDGLLLSDMTKRAARRVFEGFDPDIGTPRRIVGPPAVADFVAAKWEEARQVRKVLQTVWNVWRIDTVPALGVSSTGKLRVGTAHDEQLVADWGESYGREKSQAPIDVRGFMLRKLRRKELFIWADVDPSTIATLSARTENGVKISAVYTPDEKRGAGHATNAVAKLVEQEILGGRKFVTLVTEDGEDHLDRMYQSLGFQRIGQRHCYSIDREL